MIVPKVRQRRRGDWIFYVVIAGYRKGKQVETQWATWDDAMRWANRLAIREERRG